MVLTQLCSEGFAFNIVLQSSSDFYARVHTQKASKWEITVEVGWNFSFANFRQPLSYTQRVLWNCKSQIQTSFPLSFISHKFSFPVPFFPDIYILKMRYIERHFGINSCDRFKHLVFSSALSPMIAINFAIIDIECPIHLFWRQNYLLPKRLLNLLLEDAFRRFVCVSS